MKIIALITHNKLNEIYFETPFDESIDNRVYEQLIQIGLKYELRIVILSYLHFNDGLIEIGWTYNSKWERVLNIVPDLIFDRFHPIDNKSKKLKKILLKSKIEIFNTILFSNLCLDKYESFLKFKDYFIPTFLINKNYLQRDINIIKEIEFSSDFIPDHFIVKPRFGYESKGISIIKLEQICKLKGTNLILQPLLETKQGVLNIPKRHDLRVIITNGTIQQVYLRIPKNDNFIAGLKYGAEVKHFDINVLPVSIIEITNKIDKELEEYCPRHYSIDFGVGLSNKPWVFEINSIPRFKWIENDQEDYIQMTLLQTNIIETIYKLLYKEMNKGILPNKNCNTQFLQQF